MHVFPFFQSSGCSSRKREYITLGEGQFCYSGCFIAWYQRPVVNAIVFPSRYRLGFVQNVLFHRGVYYSVCFKISQERSVLILPNSFYHPMCPIIVLHSHLTDPRKNLPLPSILNFLIFRQCDNYIFILEKDQTDTAVICCYS